jgi:hypothetical protein
MFDYRSMFDLTGTTALVVGAGSGMGEFGRGMAERGSGSIIAFSSWLDRRRRTLHAALVGSLTGCT